MLVFPSHAFSFNIDNRQGRGLSRVQIWYKIVEYLSQDYHEINWKFTNREITCWGITCRNITRCKTTSHELGHVNRKWTFRIPEQISSITVQTLDTNLVASRRIEGEMASLPVNLCRSKHLYLKLPMQM